MDDDSVRSLTSDCCESVIQFVAAGNNDLMDFKTHPARPVDLLEKRLHERIVGIAEGPRGALLALSRDQFEALCCGLSGGGSNPVTLPSGRARLLISPVAIGSPAITTMGMLRGRIFCRVGGRGLHGDDDIDLAENQFRSQLRKASVLTLCRSNFDLDVLPFDITKVAERLTKRPQRFWSLTRRRPMRAFD